MSLSLNVSNNFEVTVYILADPLLPVGQCFHSQLFRVRNRDLRLAIDGLKVFRRRYRAASDLRCRSFPTDEKATKRALLRLTFQDTP